MPRIQGICVKCNKNLQFKKDAKYYRLLCRWCRNGNCRRKIYRKYLKLECENCGFKPINICQLDIHHKDENHNNNNLDNLETLCANCHRLKHN